MPEGLTIHANWISPAWEAFVLKSIERGRLFTGSTVRPADYPGAVVRYGARCNYGNAIDGPTLPKWAAVLSTLHPRVAFNHITVNCYQPGNGIAWHRDHESCGDIVSVLSLGGDAWMRMRAHARASDYEDDERWLVPARSLVELAGPARWDCDHMIEPVSSWRVSIVMRQIPAPG